MTEKKKVEPSRAAEAAITEKKIAAKTKTALTDEDLDKVVGGATKKKA